MKNFLIKKAVRQNRRGKRASLFQRILERLWPDEMNKAYDARCVELAQKLQERLNSYSH